MAGLGLVQGWFDRYLKLRFLSIFLKKFYDIGNFLAKLFKYGQKYGGGSEAAGGGRLRNARGVVTPGRWCNGTPQAAGGSPAARSDPY
jgi:hypothetical protein